MWVHHGATLYCLLEGLAVAHCRCCLLTLILRIVRWSCVLSCSVSHSTAPMISVGSVVKVVSSSSSRHRRRKFDIQNPTSAEKIRSAREIARKGVSKIQIRYIYLDDAM